MNPRLTFMLGADFSSRLVAWYGQGYGGFSHVAALMPDGNYIDARSDWLGKIAPGVAIRNPLLEPSVRSVTVELEATPEQFSRWSGFLTRTASLHPKYDKGAILGFILGRRDHQRGHWICSALQRQALREAKLLKATSGIPDSQVTPDALYQTVTDGLGGRVILRVG